MYPDLEAVRRNSDVEKVSDMKRSSYLEKNCNQIFVKGPALTKEILEKVNADIVSRKTYLFGYEMKTKRFLFIAGLCLLFSLSCSATSVIWLTDVFDDYVLSVEYVFSMPLPILQYNIASGFQLMNGTALSADGKQMVITNNNDSFKMWKNPTPKLIYGIYLFNYTNVDAYRKGWERELHVQEVGPYAYEETLERVNVEFIDDERVSFQDRRTYRFRPDLSVGSQSDLLTVPNIPMISGSAMMKHQNFFARLTFAAALRGLDIGPFIKLSAHDFITGYDDRLYEASRVLSNIQNIETPEKFALLAAKMGLNPRVITMNTGKHDLNKLGQFEKINGHDKLSYFATDECNSVESGDAAVFPPKWVQQKKTLYFLFPEVCRRIPLVFEAEDSILDGKVATYRYVLPEDIFDSPEEKPDNRCYCTSPSRNCSLKGIFNASACNFDSPMFVSHPHFQRADPRVFNGITGLDPKNKDFRTYMNIHPIMGFAMSGTSYLQMNVQVQKANGVSQMDMFHDGMFLPIAWIKADLSDKNLPQDFIDLINFLNFTTGTLKMAIKFGCLLTSVTVLISLVLVFRRLSTTTSSCRQMTKTGSLVEES